jgi:hypothetical protein
VNVIDPVHLLVATPLLADLESTLFVDCGWIEGTRTFNIMFGALTSAVCFSIAVPTLWWVLPRYAKWIFPPELDRNRYIQLAYGIFCMAMAFTDALCRFIPHAILPWVHPAFFVTTVIIAIGLGPRVAYLVVRDWRRGRHPLGRAQAVPAPAS